MSKPLIDLSDDSLFSSSGSGGEKRGISTPVQTVAPARPSGKINLNDDALFYKDKEAATSDVLASRYAAMYGAEKPVEQPKSTGIMDRIDQGITNLFGTNKANPEEINKAGIEQNKIEEAKKQLDVAARRAELGTDSGDRGYAMKTFDSAAAGLAGFVGSTAEYLGRQFGIKTLEEVGQKAQVDAAALTPKEQDLLQKVAGGVGSFLPMAVGGIYTGAATVAATGSRVLGSMAGAGAGMALEAPSIGQEAYEGAKKETGNEAVAERQGYKAIAYNLPLSYITNKLGFFGDTGGRIAQTAKTLLFEGGQEGGQKLLTNVMGYQETGKGVSEETLVGGLTGGVVKQFTYSPETPETGGNREKSGDQKIPSGDDRRPPPGDGPGQADFERPLLDFFQVRDTLVTKPSVAAVLYADSQDPETKQLISAAVDRAEIRDQFTQALGDTALMDDTRKEMSQFPDFIQDLQTSLVPFVQNMPPAVVKVGKPKAPTAEDLDRDFDDAWNDVSYVAEMEREAERVRGERQKKGLSVSKQNTQVEPQQNEIPVNQPNLNGVQLNEQNRAPLEAFFADELQAAQGDANKTADLKTQMAGVGFTPSEIKSFAGPALRVSQGQVGAANARAGKVNFRLNESSDYSKNLANDGSDAMFSGFTELDQAKEDVKDALFNLWDVASDATNAKMNITGQRYTVADLPKALQKVMEALAKLGYVKFKDMTGRLMERMYANPDWAPLAQYVSPKMLRDAYNSLPAFEGKEDSKAVNAVTREELAPLVKKPAARSTSNEDTPESRVAPTKKVEPKVTKEGSEVTGSDADQLLRDSGFVQDRKGNWVDPERKKPEPKAGQKKDLPEPLPAPSKELEAEFDAQFKSGKKDPLKPLTVTAEVRSRIEKIEDNKTRDKADELLKLGKYDEAEAVVNDYYKKEAAPKTDAGVTVEGLRGRFLFLDKVRKKFRISDRAMTGETELDAIANIAEGKSANEKAAELLADGATQSNLETANELLRFEAARVMRALMKQGKYKAAQQLFDRLDLGYRAVQIEQQEIRAGKDVAPGDVGGGKIKDDRKAIPEKTLEKYPALKRHIEELRTKFQLLEQNPDASTVDIKEAKNDISSTLKNLGQMTGAALQEANDTWAEIYRVEDAPRAQGKLRLLVNLTPRQQKLHERLSRIVKETTGANLLRDGIEDIKAKIRRLDELIAEEQPQYTRDELKGLFGFYDENAYSFDQEGFRPDRPITTRDELVAQRSLLYRDLSEAVSDGIKGKAKRLQKGFDRLRDRFIEAGQAAVAGGMSFEEAAQVIAPFNRSMGLVSIPEVSESLSDLESKAGAADRDVAAAMTGDMFEGITLAEQVAKGEVSAKEATKIAESLNGDQVVRDAMFALANQIRQIGTDNPVKVAETQSRIRQAASWISQNMRAGTLTFKDVTDAFRGAGLDMPLELIQNSITAFRTSMLDYTKQMGGGYAPREAWLRSMDQALQFRPEARTDGTFSDAELEMHAEWTARQQRLLNRRDPVRIGDSAYLEDAFDGMLFMQYGLAEMRNPRLIANERDRLALTNNIADLVGAWHRDLQLALDSRPDMSAMLLDSETGRILPTDLEAHKQWREQNARAQAQKAEMIERSKFFMALPQMELSDLEMETLRNRMIQADLAQMDEILHNANELAKIASGAKTRIDPETGEIITDVEEAMADYVDQLVDQDIGQPVDNFAVRNVEEDTDIDQVTDEEGNEVLDPLEAAAEVEQEQDKIERDHRKADFSRFKRGLFSGKVTHAIVSEWVQQIRRLGRIAPEIIVLKNTNQLPDGLREQVQERLGGNVGAKGLYVAETGQVYVFSDFISSRSDVEFTVFHEVYGHFGMRGFLGTGLDAFLQRTYDTNPQIKAAVDKAMEGGRMGVLEATEEVLSDLAATNKYSGIIKQFVGRVITGLRDAGFTRVAGWLSTKTDAEVAYVLGQARRVARGESAALMGGAPSEVRFAEERLPYELFAGRQGKTRAYARFNPITQKWMVFEANGPDLRGAWNTSTETDFGKVMEKMRKYGRVDRRLRSGLYVDNKIPSDLQKIPEFRINFAELNLLSKQGVKDLGRLIKRNFTILFQNEYLPVFETVEYLRSKGRITEQMDLVPLLEGNHERATGEELEYLRKIYERPLMDLVKTLGQEGGNKTVAEAGLTLPPEVIARVGKLNIVDAFLIAMHAAERNKHIAKINPNKPDGGSGMLTNDASAILDELRKQPYARTLGEISRILRKMSDYKIAIMTDSGMISEKEAIARGNYKNYVNLSGFNDGLDHFDDPGILAGGPKFGTRKDKRARGRETLATDVLARTILSFESAVINARKNHVKQRLLAMLEMNYDPDFAVIQKQAYKAVLDENGQVTEKIDENYIKNKNVMIVHVAGRPITIEFKQHGFGTFADAIHGTIYPPQTTAWPLRVMGKFNQVLGQMLTTWNPVWSVINYSRDVQDMMATATTKAGIGPELAKQMWKYLPAARAAAFHVGSEGRYGKGADQKMIEYYNEMKMAGGATSFLNFRGLEQKVEELQSLISGREPNKFQKVGLALVEAVEHFNIPLEMAPRLAAYRVMRENGLSQEQAARISGEITVNFNMRGSAKWARQWFLFFNPAVQGTAKMLKLAKDNPQTMTKIAGGLFAVGFIANMIARALGGEDDDGINKLDKIPVYKRATSIVLWPEMPLMAVPIPYGWNVFYAAGNFFADTMYAGSISAGTTAKRIAQAAFEGFSPIGSAGMDSQTWLGTIFKALSPTAAEPLVSLALNENRFGAPIVKQEGSVFGQGKRANSEMAFESASPISSGLFKGLNRLTGGDRVNSGLIDVNPGVVDYLIGSYIPGLGNEAYKTASWATAKALGYETKEMSLPLVDRLTAKVPQGYNFGMFRRAEELVNTKFDDYKLNPANREKVLKEYPNLGTARSIVNSAKDQIQALRSARGQLDLREDLSREQRVKLYNLSREKEKEIVSRAVKLLLETNPQMKQEMLASE